MTAEELLKQMSAEPFAEEMVCCVIDPETRVIDVPCGCCQTVTVQNTGVAAVQVDNPNLTAVRVCG